VADVAVFTGEEIPRRAVLPERLIGTLPGILGREAVEREKARLENRGEPIEEGPRGVLHSAHLPDPVAWSDPLSGYAYDSINRDALLRLATVRDGRLELPGGARYAVLVLPAPRPMSPEGDLMTPEVAARLRELVSAGATLLVDERPTASPSLSRQPTSDETVREIAALLWPGTEGADHDAPIDGSAVRRFGHGRVVRGPFRGASFAPLGVPPDLLGTEGGQRASGLAWTHRQEGGTDLYFLSNQEEMTRDLEVSLRSTGRWPELWDAVTGETHRAGTWRIDGGHTRLPVRLPPAGSVFVVLREPTDAPGADEGRNWPQPRVALRLEGRWRVSFDPGRGGPPEPLAFGELSDWTTRSEPGVRHYSGTAVYERTFVWSAPAGGADRVFVDLGRVANLGEVTLNDTPCGVAWTAPYRVDITDAVRSGENRLRVRRHEHVEEPPDRRPGPSRGRAAHLDDGLLAARRGTTAARDRPARPGDGRGRIGVQEWRST
jgi:hypothetical protein